MTFKYRHRKEIIIGIVVFLILIVSTCSLVFYFNNREEEDDELVVDVKKTKKEDDKTIKETYKVDIKGEVNNPGIYSLDSSCRVIDVIDKAGGLTENADTSVINLSKKISDEMVIIIYSKEQVAKFSETKEVEANVQNKCAENEEYSLVNDACYKVESSSSLNTKVSINTGSLEELMTLTGIGEAKAKDIISYREANGGFTTIEEITNVSGIGDSIFAQIKEDITV